MDKKPTFSIVYTNPDYDQYKIAKAVNALLDKDKWVGISTDRQFNSVDSYDENIVISVVSIFTDYMHFGVGVSKNYRRNPTRAGRDAAKQAVKYIHSDKYVDSYVQFSRLKNQDYGKIVRTPPYFILSFASGNEVQRGKFIPGNEIEFLHGILEYLGPNIPVFGGSASSDFEDFLNNNKGENYQFAYGKALRNAGIVVFVVSNLFFTTDVRHGYKATNKYAAITKLDKTGYNILEINGKSPVDEYCRLINISKKEYLKNPFFHGLKNPFGFVTLEGDAYIREVMPNEDNKTFHSTYQLKENYVLNIFEFDEKSHHSTMQDTIYHASRYRGNMALGLFCNCCTRRILLEENIEKMHSNFNYKNSKLPIFGFYSFGELGSTDITSAQLHSETVTSLVIFDNLLTD